MFQSLQKYAFVAIELVTRSGHPCSYGGMFTDTTRSTAASMEFRKALFFMFVCLFAKAFWQRGPVGFTVKSVDSTVENIGFMFILIYQ